MDWPTVVTGAYAALATVVVALLRKRQINAEAKKTELEGQLGITQEWSKYAHALESRLDRMQGRLDTLEGEAHFWREKHIETQASYTQLKVEASVLRERVAHVEAENITLRQIMTENGLTPPGLSPAPKTPQARKRTAKKTPARKKSSPKKARKKT